MLTKIDSLLIIDGCDQTTRNNEEIIRSTNMVRHVSVYNNAKSAVSYIGRQVAKGKDLPNVIFIGTKLRIMTTWDFLEVLRSHAPNLSKNEVYIINSGSNTSDLIKNSFHPLTQQIINTPLIEWEIKGILSKYVLRWSQGVV